MCSDSEGSCIDDPIAYIKASNATAGDWFGVSVALSSDGNTLAVGAREKDSKAGAVYVFRRSGSSWMEEANLTASNSQAADYFGVTVAISGDGDTLAVGAIYEDGDAVGVNQPSNDSATNSGAVYVFTRSAGMWSEQAYVKASNTSAGDGFGYGVALSYDGDTLAVSANGEDSSFTGVSDDQTGEADDTAENSGAVYVFTRTRDMWKQQAYVKASNTEEGDRFGYYIALSGDGDTLAVSADLEGSDAEGIDNDENNNLAPNSGAVYVFTRTGEMWSKQAYVKASNTDASDQFGYAVALSGNGDTLAVGAIGESSGNPADEADDTAPDSGAVYVYTRTAGMWSKQAYIKASNAQMDDVFGTSVALSADGNILAVGARDEDSSATGINGDQTDNLAENSGAVYLLMRSAEMWSQKAYIKASNTGAGDLFGAAATVALSGDGSTLAVGAYGEDSNAVGVGGDQSNNDAPNAGAVYVY